MKDPGIIKENNFNICIKKNMLISFKFQNLRQGQGLLASVTIKRMGRLVSSPDNSGKGPDYKAGVAVHKAST